MNAARMAFFFGRLTQGLFVVSLAPLLFALAEGEPSMPFLWMTVLTAGCAALFSVWGLRWADALTLREGIAVTGLVWVLASALGAVPYVAGGWLGCLDGFLESVSGYTGAGATVMTSIATLPKSILLWRALTHWIGGLGVIVFFIALLPQFGQGAAYLFETESGGAMSERVLPRMTEMAKTLLAVYALFTAAAMLAYAASGMTFFDAACHSMSTIATGGFSNYDDSAAHFHSPALEWWMIFFMVVSSGDFGMYAATIRHGVKAVLQNAEFRFFLVMVSLCSFAIAAELFFSGTAAGEAARSAFFQASSVASTTGFVSADFDRWPPFSKLCLLFLMLVGGCSGSTAGGFKAVRILLLVRLIARAGRRMLSPNAREEMMLGGRRASGETLFAAGHFFFAYCAICVLWTLIFVWDGSTLLDSVALSLTTMGNVGPGFGEWGATSTYAGLPPLSKVTAAVSMLVGRLEIFPMIVMLRPGFWRKEQGWD